MKPTFVRFSTLTNLALRCDYHVHTIWTDGSATAEEYIKAALRKDIGEIAFTEHVRKTSSWFDSFIEEIEGLRDKYRGRLTVIYGIEAKVTDYEGNLDATVDMIRKSEIVLGAIHRYPDGKGGYLDFQKIPFYKAAEIECKLACALTRNSDVNVLAHLGGVFEREFRRFLPVEYVREIIESANQYGTVIEINSSYLSESSPLFELCSVLDPLISLGSDAHNLEQLGQVMKLMDGKLGVAKHQEE